MIIHLPISGIRQGVQIIIHSALLCYGADWGAATVPDRSEVHEL